MDLRNMQVCNTSDYTAVMSILTHNQIDSLTFQEKVSLIDNLWASLDCAQAGAALDDAYDSMLERRLAVCDRGMDELITLDRAIRQLRETLEIAVRWDVSATDAA